MIKCVFGVFYDLSTPHGKMLYTVAAMKKRKVDKAIACQKMVDNTIIGSVEKCSHNKRGMI